jgi:hypothetical protein
MQDRAAGSVNAPYRIAIKWLGELCDGVEILWIDAQQASPTTANSYHLVAQFAYFVDDRLDTRIESRNIAAARENSNFHLVQSSFRPGSGHFQVYLERQGPCGLK